MENVEEEIQNTRRVTYSDHEVLYEYYSNHIKSEKYLIRFSFGDLNIVQSMFVNLIDE